MADRETLLHTFWQLVRFGIIGVAAAITHYVVALLLVGQAILPAWANLFAFITAFWVSYFGHRYFSFQAHDLEHQQTLPRFLLVAVIGFVFNETLLLLMLHYTSIGIQTGLPVIIVLTAVMTFVLSRFFAFRPSSDRK